MSATPGGARMQGLDALRGFALFGLFLVHMPELFELYWLFPATDPLQLAVHDAVFTVFGGKAFALMALCFGVSFFVIMDSAARRGEDYSGRFVWRLVLLGLMGLLHGLWYRGDILEVLAVMGLFLLPFHRVRSNRVLLGIAALFLLQPLMLVQIVAGLAGAEWANRPPAFWDDAINPLYTTGSLLDTVRVNISEGHAQKWAFMYGSGRLSQILGLSLVGMVLGRSGFFARPQALVRLRWTGLLACLAAALALYWLRGPLSSLVPASQTLVMPRDRASTVLGSLFDLSVTGVLLFGFTALYYGPAGRWLGLFAAPGRMTLSLYVGQSLVFVPVFYGYGLGLYASMTQLQAVLWALPAFAVQMVLAHLWFGHFHYGPLEWIWRAAARLDPAIPFRKRRLA